MFFCNKKMTQNILEITNNLGLGGTEKTMQIYCKQLNKRMFKVFACGFVEGGARENVIRESVHELLIAKSNEKAVIEFIIKNKIDIVHWHSIDRQKKLTKIKSVLKYCKENNIMIIETSPFSLFDKEIEDLLDVRVFVSKANMVKLFYKYKNLIDNQKRYYYLYNPLDIEQLERYKLSPKERYTVRKKFGISSDDFVIGRIGRGDIWKWSNEIIDVVPYLLKDIPSLKVVIRSLPKEKLEKIRKYKLDKYFILLPETSSEKELSETYQVIDVLVHTSRIGECNSVAINEAMFYGLPVITNSTDFMQPTLFDRDNGQIEIVKNNINGFYINGAEAIAQKVKLLYDNKILKDKIANNNILKAKKLFDYKLIIKEFERITLKKYNSLNEVEKTYLQEYKENVLKDSCLNLFRINATALLDLGSIYLNAKNNQ